MPRVLGYHDWERIKAEYCTGELTSAELAQKFRVSQKTLRSRASREQWPTPARIKDTMDKAVQLASEVVMQGIMGSEVQGSVEHLAMNGILPQLGECPDSGYQMRGGVVSGETGGAARSVDVLSYQQALAEFAMRKVEAGFGKMKPPSNWRELAVADGIARKALGLDKGGASAAAMVRIQGPNGSVIDVGAGVQMDDGSDDQGFDDED